MDEKKGVSEDCYQIQNYLGIIFGLRLHPDNINRDSGIEIPEAWIPTIKQHNNRSVPMRTAKGTTRIEILQSTTA